MNQGRIWCVVHPTVGLPLLIGSVAVTSLIVHASVMTHTTWMSDFFQGGAAKTAQADSSIAPVASNVTKTGDGYVITVKVAPDASVKLSAADTGLGVAPLKVATAATE